MEISFIVVLWIIVTIIEAVTDKKRRAELPPPQNTDFEILPPTNPSNQTDEFNFVELYQHKKQAERKIEPQKIKSVDESKNFDLEITPTNAMNAIILSEILDKPKALRRRR